MTFQKKPVRRSQLISPWGVGAIIPFPGDESLMIAGLDMWDFGRNKDFEKEYIIEDERFAKFLEVKYLKMPPDFKEQGNFGPTLLKIPAVRFPRWHYCPFCGTMTKLGAYSSHIERCSGHKWNDRRSCHDKRFRPKLIPERFIVLCENGHIDDFPVMEWVHQDHPEKITENCLIRRSTGGVSSTLTGVRYECTCGESKSLAGIMKPGSLNKINYFCKGSKPWLGIESDTENLCGKSLHVAQRGATNVWFGVIKSSLLIPVDTESTRRSVLVILDEYYEKIKNYINSRRINGEIDTSYLEFLAEEKKVDPTELKNAFFTRYENLEPLMQKTNDDEEQYRYAEYNVLKKSSGNDKQKFHSVNYKIDNYNELIKPYFNSISLVPKLKETRALVGFSRLEPKENLTLMELKSTLCLKKTDWLPAVEVFGEGLFFEFNIDYINQWLKKEEIKRRENLFFKNINKINMDGKIISMKYILIHTFAHILINQLSYECGYGSSSLRERIYCGFEKKEKENDMNGVLIYTASADSEGSMGGLVRQGRSGSIENIILSAIEKARWCTSDPICIQSSGQGPDSCNLAACHNCALVSETSCEKANKYLDRALLIGTLENPDSGYFSDLFYWS